MTYTPLTYPATLTKAHWDKKKGLIGKAAGETGVGDAAAKAETAFKAIKWDSFDIIKHSPTASNAETLKHVVALKDAVVGEHGKSVKPTIDALHILANKATKASTDLAKNKLFKDAGAAAGDIAKAANFFAVALALNGVFFQGVLKEWETSKSNVEKVMHAAKEANAKTSEYLKQLLQGVAKLKVAPHPDVILWDKEVKQQGRNVSNTLKGNPELAKKHLKIWATKFQGFDWGTLGYANIKSEAELKATVGKFADEVIAEAKTLAADLKV
jgi:hypothetical protein